MATILVTPDRLEEDARQVRLIRDAHDNEMARFRKLVDGLSAEWKGGAHDAYVAQFNGMQGTFEKFSETVGEYALFMENYAKRMRELDDSARFS